MSAVGSICRGTGTRYQARVRNAGSRYWSLSGKPSKSYGVAIKRMAAAFAEGGYKRADVVMYADYYDALQMCELVSR